MLITANLPLDYFMRFDTNFKLTQCHESARAIALVFINSFRCDEVAVRRQHYSDVAFVEAVLLDHDWFLKMDLFDQVAVIHDQHAFYISLKQYLRSYNARAIRASPAVKDRLFLAITT